MIFPSLKSSAFSADIHFLAMSFTERPRALVLSKPPVWLESGDEVTIELEGIGQLNNSVVAP